LTVRKRSEPVTREKQLRQDLLGRQVADEALRTGVTERTGERTADLAGNAKCAAALFRNVDGFHFDRPACSAWRETQQPFAGAVVRNLLLDDLRPGDGEMRLQHL